jgi:flagella basal body P-ring formation protein FlgA
MVTCIRQREWRVSIVVGAAAVALASWATASTAAVIALRPQAMPESTVVRLGDVADVRAESSQEAARLAALPLMPAPAAGTRRYLRMREVQDLLAAHGEELGRLNFRGETVIEVASPAAVDPTADDEQGITRERRRAAWLGTASATVAPVSIQQPTARLVELRDELRRIIVAHLERTAGQEGQWHVEPKVSNRHLQLLPAAASPPSCEGGKPPWTGAQRFIISFPTAQGDAKFAVAAEVTRPQSVVVAVRPIERGGVVTAAHVEVQERDDLPPAVGRRVPIESVEGLLGMEAARVIQAGQVIFSDDVQAPLLVKRGEEVTVYARGGGIQVRTLARARQDGARGELVPVESLETRERYDAVVVGLRAAVVFGGGTAPTADVAERPLRRPGR